MKSKKINILFYLFLSFVYLEFAFRFFMFDNVIRLTNINMVLYVLFSSVVVYIVTKLFNKRFNKALFYILITAFCVWFAAQFVVKDVFDFYISFSILQIADQVGNGFVGQAVIEVFRRIIKITLLFLPLILAIVFRKRFNFERNKNKKTVAYLIVAAIFFVVYLAGLNIGKNENYSAYDLFYKVNDPAINIEKVGVLNTMGVDSFRAVFGFNEKIVINNKKKKKKEEKEKTFEYNNLDIDFDTLMNENKDSLITSMSEYFKNETGTLQNEYTSYFKGKNLIMFMAESFNEIAVREDTSPTLYKLANSGFVFENFYSQTIGSTLGGEFQELTGLYANMSSLPVFRSGTTSFPMGLSTIFENAGYNTYAYHDHSYTFQDRGVYLKTLGFDNFKACRNGLEQLINCNSWPESDVEMIEQTFNDYADSEKPFMVFYASVSGHGDYTWTGNLMAKKHKEEIEALELGYSDKVTAYLAAQMEFDRALELLLTKLEEKGILDNTVIVIAGDHYPYMLSIEQVNEAATYSKDDVIEVNHSNLIIYNSAMKTTNISKVGGQMDILPTVYNLFGLPYDSRLIIGNDILSTEPGLAIFGNRSWVSDYGKYYSGRGTFEPNTEVAEDYVENMNTDVANRINMSKYIIDKNYYKTAWNYVKQKPVKIETPEETEKVETEKSPE